MKSKIAAKYRKTVRNKTIFLVQFSGPFHVISDLIPVNLSIELVDAVLF